jgi:hypothetical protein
MTSLEISILAGGVAAFAGALTGVMALSGAMTPDLSGGQGKASLDGRLTLGSYLLASHAITAAALWQAPTIGSCLAASLGAGWLGAAAASLIAMMSQPDRPVRRIAHTAFRAAVGFALVSPLWSYVEIMKRHAAMAG